MVDSWTVVATGVVTVVAAVTGWLRWWRPQWKKWKLRRQQRDAVLLGRPAVVDPASGRELAPKYPGVGELVADLTDSVKTLTVTVLQDHEARIKKLEDATVERVVSKVESAHMFKAMEAAIKAEPDETVESDD